MTNLFSNKMYQEVKNNSYVVIGFRNGKRFITHDGVGLYDAMKLQKIYQGINNNVLIVSESDIDLLPLGVTTSNRNIEDFEILFKLVD